MTVRTLLLTILLLPTPALAEASRYLVNIPQLTGGGGFDGYINAVYAMFISIAALLAVVKIIVAGVKYMFSDIVTQKSDAKKDIRGALLGLVIVLAAVLILTVINPDLTNFEFEQRRLAAVEPTGTRSETPLSDLTQNEVWGTQLTRNASLAQTRAFELDCIENGNRFEISATIGARCYTREQETLDEVRDELSDGGVDDEMASIIVNQYDRTVTPYEIIDPIELAAIAEELGVDESALIFSVRIPTRIGEYPGDLEADLMNICSGYAQARSNENIDLAYDPGMGFASCADAS